LREDPDGLKMATVLAEFMATVPGTSTPCVSLSVNVNRRAAGDELIVAGSIGSLKVALSCLATTTLARVLVLVGTSWASLPGLKAITLGAEAATGSKRELPLPSPHAGTKADSINAMTQRPVVSQPCLQVFISLSM
jgi:hypothetical protein